MCKVKRYFSFQLINRHADEGSGQLISSVARGGGKRGRPPPQSSPEMSFVILPNPLRNWRGGESAAFFSNTCGSVICQCYKRNRNEILALISDILVRFSQQKNQKFSARFARTSILASSLYHLGIIFVPWPAIMSRQGMQLH